MNNDLTNFIVEFSTKGLAELKQGIKDLGDKIDEVGKKFQEGQTHGKSFLSSLDSIASKVEAIGAAVATLGFKKAFDIKNESLELQRFSSDTGIAAQNIEALGLALKFGGFGGDKGTASGFFTNLQLLREKLQRGEIGDSEVKEWANDLGFSISPNAGIAEYIQTISQSLYDLDKAGRIADRMRLADSLGIDRTMELFLKEGPEYVRQALKEAGAETWLSDPTVARRSAELNTNWEKFKNQFNKMFSDEWLKAANDLVDVLTKLEPTMGKLVNQLGGAVGESLRGISHVIDLFQGKTSLADFSKMMEENKQFSQEIGRVIGTVFGGIIGLLIGHPLLGAAIGNWLGGKLGSVDMPQPSPDVSPQETFEALSSWTEKDFQAWKNSGTPFLNDYLRNTQKGNIITNIKLDPTKPTDMTQNPDGTWTTRDGRGMTIVSREAM